MALTPGTRFGPYQVAAVIGAGGMGEVYRATDTTLEREVAIKVLPESLAADSDRIARFEREAKTLASLNHENIAHLYGLERSDGVTALVMELVTGPTLAERIAQGPIPADEALNLAMQIAGALEAAHARGIVHRDLKPANIKLRSDGTVKVLDFGIAKVFETHTTSGPQASVSTTPAMTQTGMVLGTAAYMSPEQARGKPVDQRSDIWAFGVVLYEMLTGKSAFGGEDVTTTLARVLERDPDMKALPASIALAVRQTLQLCLQKDLKKRVADIRDVRLALAGAFDSSLDGAHAAAAARSVWLRARTVAAGLVAGALLAGAFVWTLTRPEPLQPPRVTRFLVTPPATAPLSDDGGLEVAISPDGTRLAYVGRGAQSDRVALYLRDFDGLDARMIPGTEGTQPGALNPFFSADGKWLGFNSPGRGIMRVAVSGGPPLKMLDEPPGGFLGAAWAADDTLIFSTTVSLNRTSAGGGGTPERLTPEPQVGGAFYFAPALLPGGRAVLFNRREGGVQRVTVLDLETREQRVLVEGGQNPTYAATGHIIFARGTALMAVPFDLARLAVTGEPVALLQGVRQTSAADYVLSAGGTLVYVPGGAVSTATGALVWVDRTGRITEPALAEPVANPRDPRLSPDGRRLVLTTGLSGLGGLWIYDLGGRPAIPLADERDSRLATWNPDGKQIVFSSDRGGGYELYTAPADGSLEPIALRRDKLGASPSVWSDGGELILVSPLGGAGDILATRVEPEAELRDVVVSADAEFDAALSPNGHWLAYASNRTGGPEIWVKRYPAGVAVRISRDGGVEPRWSADGQELFYLQGNAMMAVAVKTEGEFAFDAAVALFDDPSFFANPGQIVHSYDVARDGRFLMIRLSGASTDTAGSIVVVQNWFEELKQRVPTK